MNDESRRPIHSVGAAEILPDAEAIDEGRILKLTISILLGTRLRLLVSLEPSNAFGYLSTQRICIAKTIRADANVIPFEYET